MIIDKLIDRIIETQNPTAIGLDTRLEYLPKKLLKGFNPKKDGFAGAAELILRFNKDLIDGVCDIIPCMKIQVAYYEMYGYHGMKAFYKTIKYAKKRGMIVISDVKRNDIGATSEAYANAHIGITPIINKPAFDSDFATVTAYLGSDGITPFIKVCEQNKKGIFVLVKTSNPSSGELQDKLIDGKPVYDLVGEQVALWGQNLIGTYGYSSAGAVVGATYSEQGKHIRETLPSVFFLIPGYGAQGATGKDITNCFDDNGLGGVVNASRSLICAYKSDAYAGMDYICACRNAAIDMRDDIIESLEKANKTMIKTTL